MRWRLERAYIVAWGVLLAVSATVLATVGEHAWPAALLGAASACSLILGGVVVRREGGHAVPETVPERSLPTAWLTLGFSLAVLGAGLGWWLSLIGAQIALVGAGGVLRERRTARG